MKERKKKGKKEKEKKKPLNLGTVSRDMRLEPTVNTAR